MSLRDLTSEEAVERALAEFDEVGRKTFLSKYGFGESRDWFIVHKERIYDSKAVAGAAVGHQHPDTGALKPSDFSGGAATVVKALTSLGFEVQNLGLTRLRRSNPYYKLAAIIAALRVQEDGWISIDRFKEAFTKIVEPYQPGGGAQWWEPFFHLQNDDVWTLYQGEQPAVFDDLARGRPKGGAGSVVRRADRAKFKGGYLIRTRVHPHELEHEALRMLEKAHTLSSVKPEAATTKAERERRKTLWENLCALGDTESVTNAQIQTAKIRPANTGHSVFRNLTETEHLAPSGVSQAFLDTGATYTNAFDEEGGVFHYPTNSAARKGRDLAEIEASKAAYKLKMPVFVILPGPTSDTRRVRQAWVVDYDDAARTFLFSFQAPASNSTLQDPFNESPFAKKQQKYTKAKARPGQSRFRFNLIKRYGTEGIECAVCEVKIKALLEAAHIIPVEDKGSDSVGNGLVLCRNHHRAFDKNFFAINPSSLAICTPPTKTPCSELGITKFSLNHLPATPNPEALKWRWDSLKDASEWAHPLS